MSHDQIQQLETCLDSFDAGERKEALQKLYEMAASGQIELPKAGSAHNLHYHTFFSYNACGYSPSHIAWLAKKNGLALAGTVDFDVLDSLEEFYEAGVMVDLKVTTGLETRVFVPEFADKEISSPGEPGIAYHMGVGIPHASLEGSAAAFRKKLRETAQQRTRDMVARVNPYLSPVELDYEKDVIPLTPKGNATERHLCLAYARKAHELYPDPPKLREFWKEKLGDKAATVELPEGTAIEALIRGRTMKRGGIGYVHPDGGSFPKLSEMNAFVLEAGGIPTHTWLNGLSDGEQELERLLEIGISTGVAAMNIIPDRNYTPGKGSSDIKCRKLYEAVALAEKLDLPLVVGTEMNSPGLKFVDDFATAELQPLLPAFLQGAYIVYAHTHLQRCASMGYLSEWAKKSFARTQRKNEFFERFGATLTPAKQSQLKDACDTMTPEQVMDIIL